METHTAKRVEIIIEAPMERRLTEALTEAGVDVQSEHYADSEHGFACSMGPTDDYQHWLNRCANFIATH